MLHHSLSMASYTYTYTYTWPFTFHIPLEFGCGLSSFLFPAAWSRGYTSPRSYCRSLYRRSRAHKRNTIVAHCTPSSLTAHYRRSLHTIVAHCTPSSLTAHYHRSLHTIVAHKHHRRSHTLSSLSVQRSSLTNTVIAQETTGGF